MQSLRTFVARHVSHADRSDRSGRTITILAMLGGPLILVLSIGAERVI